MQANVMNRAMATARKEEELELVGGAKEDLLKMHSSPQGKRR